MRAAQMCSKDRNFGYPITHSPPTNVTAKTHRPTYTLLTLSCLTDSAQREAAFFSTGSSSSCAASVCSFCSRRLLSSCWKLSRTTRAFDHPCGPDMYRGRLALDGEDTFRLLWSVTGPRKLGGVTSTFRRRPV